MKKICFIIDSIFSIGGVQRVTAVIAEALSKDHDVTIATFDKTEDTDKQLYGLENYSIKYVYLCYPEVNELKRKCCKAYSYLYRKYLPQNKYTSYIYSHSSFPKELRDFLTDELKKGDFDVIIAVHAFLAIRLATIKKELGKAKCIGWIHNSFDALLKEGSPYLGTELKYHYECQLQKLDETVVLYQEDADRYQQTYGFKPIAIYNPLTLKPGRTSLGKNKKFLSVGRFTPKHKGFDLLIEAFGNFAKKNTDWTLDIVGEGPEKDKLQEMIDKRRLDGRVTLHPFTNQIQDYYSAATIYVLSSRWEGMPLVLVEAMAHGLPIISSDLPISKEIMGDFALYFKNGDVNELAQRLEEATHIDWEHKSKEAIKIAQQYNINQIVGQWKRLLES